MKYRKKLSQVTSKKIFKKTASKTHVKNKINRKPMRGGIRL